MVGDSYAMCKEPSFSAVFVELMQGYHDQSSTLHIQSTSGTIFRAYQGQECMW